MVEACRNIVGVMSKLWHKSRVAPNLRHAVPKKSRRVSPIFV
jgi:hypothetical protein